MHVDIHLQNRCIERIELEDQPWDSRLLGLSCARIVGVQTLAAVEGSLPENLYRPLIEAMTLRKWQYVIARLPAGEWRRYHLLENVGFRFIDQIIGFRRTHGPKVKTDSGIHLRLATPGDEQAVADLSAVSFQRSRFHNDPLLTAEQCRRIYHEWGANSVRGQAARWVWVAEEMGRLVGFVTLKTREESGLEIGVIDLIGVLPDASGRGIGRSLVARSSEWLSERGIQSIAVQTQTDNLAAIRLYTQMGFKAEYASVTLRWSSRHE